MASDNEDASSSRSESDSSDETDSQHSDSMAHTSETTGIRKKPQAKKGAGDPVRQKRKKAKR